MGNIDTTPNTNGLNLTFHAGDWLKAAAAGIGPLGIELSDRLLNLFAARGISTDVPITIPLPSLAGTPSPLLPKPVDPVEVLDAIAAAIQQAERQLNQQNMLIAGGHIETQLTVSLNNETAAHANISFDIQPKPYS